MASCMPLFERHCVPVWQILLYLRAASTMRRPSLTLWLTGFSTYTSLPACMAQMPTSACQWLGVAVLTMSTDLSSKASRMSATTLGSRPCFSATCLARLAPMFSSTSTTYSTSVSGRLVKAFRWSPPRPPQPTTATPSFSLGLLTRASRRRQSADARSRPPRPRPRRTSNLPKTGVGYVWTCRGLLIESDGWPRLAAGGRDCRKPLG